MTRKRPVADRVLRLAFDLHGVGGGGFVGLLLQCVQQPAQDTGIGVVGAGIQNRVEEGLRFIHFPGANVGGDERVERPNRSRRRGERPFQRLDALIEFLLSQQRGAEDLAAGAGPVAKFPEGFCRVLGADPVLLAQTHATERRQDIGAVRHARQRL